MTVGTFGVLTLVGGDGDERPRPGALPRPGAAPALARRRAGGAAAGPGGAPFTTGFFAKFAVLAAVDRAPAAGRWP